MLGLNGTYTDKQQAWKKHFLLNNEKDIDFVF